MLELLSLLLELLSLLELSVVGTSVVVGASVIEASVVVVCSFEFTIVFVMMRSSPKSVTSLLYFRILNITTGASVSRQDIFVFKKTFYSELSRQHQLHILSLIICWANY